jgi:Carboxypeptidase regulatory-like domain/TonB dependent receptor
MTLRRTGRTGATLVLALFTMFAPGARAAAAQDATALSGTVADASGAAIPGAAVVARNVATGATFEALTDERGTFTIPAMSAATYTVTVTLTGFKTAVVENVKLEVGVPATVKATLEVGRMEETVTVTGGAEIVNTQTSTVTTTMAVKQISQIPLVSRNAMDFVAFMPGAMSTGVNRDTTFNGLPQSALNVTLDGINIQDNGAKTGDGFQVAIKPLQDQVEEVTVSTASGDAAAVGGGAVQIMYRSRSGSNTFTGSVYEYLRNPALNANYWFNNRDLPADPGTGKAPKDIVKLNQYGFRVGGPILIPRLFNGRDKAFFFFNYERYRLRQGGLRQRTVLNPQSQQGIFQYSVAGQTRQVNLYDVARAGGFTSTPDPVVADLLGDISTATAAQGGLTQLTNPNLMQYSFRSAGDNYRQMPAGRIDVNLTRAHRLAVSTNHQWFASDPGLNADRQFPGFVNRGTQDSHRNVWSTTLRSVLRKNLVNEAIGGYSDFPIRFNKFVGLDNFSGDALGSNQGGFNLGISAAGITNATVDAGINGSSNPYIQVSDTMSWVKGAHNLSFGGSYSRISRSTWSQTLVPSIVFGVDSRDPALAMFTTANFPNASSANLTAAQNLYAVLTGRVIGINGNAVLDEATNQYSYLGRLEQGGRMSEIGLFVQDNWRMTPTFTLNYGLRWDTQLPFYAENNVYSTAGVDDVWGVSGVGNLFRPGILQGARPQFVQYTNDQKAFNTDWNNLAPNVGFAWRPSAGAGWRRMLGKQNDTVFRGGYALAYNRRGMSDYTAVFSANPGATLTANRDSNLGNLGTLPLLFRDQSPLGPGQFHRARRFR